MRFLLGASLAQKISTANLIGLAALAAAILTLYQQALSSYADRQSQDRVTASVNVAWDQLKRQGEPFRVSDGKLLAGGVALNGRFDLVDHVRDMVGGVATVFMGDVRIATNVKKDDGSRAVGTKLAPGPAYDAVFKLGQPYRGKADILGRRYVTAYDPIRDETGRTVGVLFVGQPESETHREIADIEKWALSVALVVALVVAAAMLALSRRMFAPLGRLRQETRRIADGALDAAVEDARRGDDIGEMARAVEQLRLTALDKVALDRETEQRRAGAEAERSENEKLVARQNQEQERVLDGLAEALNRMASGDLTVEIGAGLPVAYRRVSEDFNSAVSALKQTISTVSGGAEAVANTSQRMASASQTLAQRAEADAASIEQTSGALDQLTARVARSAALARDAGAAMSEVGNAASLSGEVASAATGAMRKIEASSGQISDILALINEIAFQTNLLALNAGVEAARAGEAGRGFAVVAAEVRALAQRSGEASKQIAALVASSRSDVGDGVAKVAETRDALSRIIGGVADVRRMIGEIAAGAEDQSKGLDELNGAVARLGASVQENAAMAEETHSAGETLLGEAGELARSIDQFRLSDNEKRISNRGRSKPLALAG